MTADTPTSEHTVMPPPAARRRRRPPLSLLGAIVSVVALAGVVWWASHQKAPQLPHTPRELLALVAAVACYGLATLVRAERWQGLLTDKGAKPARADTYALTCVGYMGNNVLPARGGDVIRVVLTAPRAATSKRTVVGTLVAERVLDVAVLIVLLVLVGWGLLGDVGGGKVEIIVAAIVAAALGAWLAWRFVERNERLHEL